jgi:hypothetical protein
MKEIHGVADAEKVQMVNDKGHYKITVTDGDGLVIVNIADAAYPAGLTPDRARFIAKQITEAASRVESKTNGARSR